MFDFKDLIQSSHDNSYYVQRQSLSLQEKVAGKHNMCDRFLRRIEDYCLNEIV